MNVYQVGVKIAVTGNAHAFMNQFIHLLTGAHAQVNKLNRSMKALAVTMAAGAAGYGMLKGYGALINHGQKLVKIQQDMAIAGATNEQVQHAYAKAWELTAKHKNMGATEIMKMQNDARMIFGSQDVATHDIPEFVKMASFLKAYEGGKHGGKGDVLSEINAAMKSGEISGKINPAEMRENALQLTAMKVAYGEQLKITDYLAAQRTGGVAMRNTDDTWRYGIFPALVQEQKSGAGVMMMTAFQKIVAGTTNRLSAYSAMDQLGILDPSKVHYTKDGAHVKGVEKDAIQGNSLFARNPGEWVQQVLLPALNKKTSDPVEQAKWLSQILPDRKAAMFATELLQQWPKLIKDAQMMVLARNAYNAGGDSYQDKSYDGQIQAFQTQWTNLMEALGAPAVGTATAALRSLNDVLSGMNQWAAFNPESAKALVEGMGAFGAVLMGGAGVALLAALGPVGWLTLGIGSIVGVVVAFQGPIAAFIASAEQWRVGIAASMQQIGMDIIAGIAAIPGQVAATIASVFSSIGSMIMNGLKGLLPGAAAGDTGLSTPGTPGLPKGTFGKPTMSGTEKHSSIGNVYLDGHQVGTHVAANIAGRAGVSASNVAGFDASAHAMPYDYNPVG